MVLWWRQIAESPFNRIFLQTTTHKGVTILHRPALSQHTVFDIWFDKLIPNKDPLACMPLPFPYQANLIPSLSGILRFHSSHRKHKYLEAARAHVFRPLTLCVPQPVSASGCSSVFLRWCHGVEMHFADTLAVLLPLIVMAGGMFEKVSWGFIQKIWCIADQAIHYIDKMLHLSDSQPLLTIILLEMERWAGRVSR